VQLSYAVLPCAVLSCLQVCGIHSHAAQRLVSLSSLLTRRWLKLSQAAVNLDALAPPPQDIQVCVGGCISWSVCLSVCLCLLVLTCRLTQDSRSPPPLQTKHTHTHGGCWHWGYLCAVLCCAVLCGIRHELPIISAVLALSGPP